MLNQNVQRPLHFLGVLHGPRTTHAELGLPLQASGYDSQYPLPLKNKPPYICLCTRQYYILIQSHSNRFPRNNNYGPRQASKPEILGTTWSGRMVCLPNNTPLLLPNIIHSQYIPGACIQHDIFLPPLQDSPQKMQCLAQNPNSAPGTQTGYSTTSDINHLQHKNSQPKKFSRRQFKGVTDAYATYEVGTTHKKPPRHIRPLHNFWG